jgi:hypothetical protein
MTKRTSRSARPRFAAAITSPLAEMTVAQIAALSPADLRDAQLSLQTLHASVKTLLDRVHAALEQRYAEPAQAARSAAGKGFGICHLDDGPFCVSIELFKKVTWDQKQLASTAERIAAAGDHVTDYLDIEYHIPESRFNAWPPALKEQFTPARSVKPGKATYRLALREGEPQ